jgi:hypothetical protein
MFVVPRFTGADGDRMNAVTTNRRPIHREATRPAMTLRKREAACGA